jgi:hypothetical protein
MEKLKINLLFANNFFKAYIYTHNIIVPIHAKGIYLNGRVS